MEQYLQLTPNQFDQDKTGGWRVLATQGLSDYVLSKGQNISKTMEAIESMKYYVDHYQFSIDQLYKKDLIVFHIGQLYAKIGDYHNALLYFNALRDQGYTKVGIEYLNLTIAFLVNNGELCNEIITHLPEDGSVINTETMMRMMKFRGSSYLEAYSGMMWDELEEWIISRQTS